MSETLHCGHCDQDLPVEQFYADRKTKTGFTVYCRAYYRQYYAANKERQKKTSYAANIKRRYDLTVDEYKALLADGCSVCGSTDRMVLDHCHATNSVRAALCNPCNLALGIVKDDPERLRQLADYLERHNRQ